LAPQEPNHERGTKGRRQPTEIADHHSCHLGKITRWRHGHALEAIEKVETASEEVLRLLDVIVAAANAVGVRPD